MKDRDNFQSGQNTPSTAGQVTSKEHEVPGTRELQAVRGQHCLETPPHTQGPLNRLREGLARAQEAVGPQCRPQGQLPAERVGRVAKAPQGRAPP